MQAVPTSRYIVFFLLAGIGCLVDLVTKSWAFARLGMPGPNSCVFWLWTGHAGFQTSLNEGALFGIGQGKVWFFALLSVVAALGILWWLFYRGAAVDWWLTISLGSVTAGILGNLYDRLGLPGLHWNLPLERAGQPVLAVRDWILIQANPNLVWPNFNLADSFLVCGAAMLAWHNLRALYPPPAEPGATGRDRA